MQRHPYCDTAPCGPDPQGAYKTAEQNVLICGGQGGDVNGIFAIAACMTGNPWWYPVNGPSAPEGAWQNMPGCFEVRQWIAVFQYSHGTRPPQGIGQGTGYHQGRDQRQSAAAKGQKPGMLMAKIQMLKLWLTTWQIHDLNQ